MQNAEDLLQQACLKVLAAKGDLSDRPYLFLAIRHLFVDTCRRRKPDHLPPEMESLIYESAATHERTVDGRLDMEVLLAGLRPVEREALFLNCVEGYSAAEISELTGEPRGTVLSHLARAKQKLRNRTSVTTGKKE